MLWGSDGSFFVHFEEAPFPTIHPVHLGGPEEGPPTSPFTPLRALDSTKFADEVVSTGGIGFGPGLSVQDAAPFTDHDIYGSVTGDVADKGVDFVEFRGDTLDDLLGRLGFMVGGKGIVFVGVYDDGARMDVNAVPTGGPRHSALEIPSITNIERNIGIDLGAMVKNVFVPVIHV